MGRQALVRGAMVGVACNRDTFQSPSHTPPPHTASSTSSCGHGTSAMSRGMTTRGQIRQIRARKRKYGKQLELADLYHNVIQPEKIDLRKAKKELSELARLAKLKLRVYSHLPGVILID